jgi:PAS domain S-box-containing protein
VSGSWETAGRRKRLALSAFTRAPRTAMAALAFLLTGMSCGGTAQGAPNEPESFLITNYTGLRSIPDVQVGMEHPVRIEAVVNLYDPVWNVFWLQDQEGGFYIHAEPRVLSVKSGQRIVISTTSKPGTRDPDMAKAQIEILQESVFPEPRSFSGDPLNSPDLHNLRIQIEGYARRVVKEADRVRLDLVAAGGPITTYLLHPPDAVVPPLEEARVRFRGVYSITRDNSGKLAGVQLWVARLEDTEVLEPNLDGHFTEVPVSIRSLYRAPTNALAQVQGTVRSQTSGKSVVLEDGTGLVTVETWQARAFPVGTAVEAIGYPVVQGPNLRLRDGLCQTSSSILGTNTVGTPAAARPVLRRADQIRLLSSEEAAQRHPASLSGVVTCFYPSESILFVQDSTGGIFVYPMTAAPDIQVGDFLLVEGVTGPGNFAPIVLSSNLTLQGTARLPEAQSVSFEYLWSGAADSQFVEIKGYVRNVTNFRTLTQLDVSSPGGELVMWVAPSDALTSLRGAVVKVRGVCGTSINERRQLTGITLYVPSIDFIEVEELAPADPFSVPVRSLASLREFNASTTLFRRTRVHGTVTYQAPRLLFLQDGDDGVLVLAQGGESLKPGDQVEVVGFPAREGRRLVIRDSVFRRTGSGPAPGALPIPEERPISEDLEARLVRTKGRLLDLLQHDREVLLTLQSEATIFTALWSGAAVPAELKAIPRGTRLSLQGVYRLQEDESGVPRSFRLYLRSTGDVEVLERPPWWTLSRALQAVGVLGVALLIGLGWVVLLRRRVGQQTEIIRQRLEHEALIEAHFRELVENASEIIFALDLEGRFTSLNQAALRLFGYDGEEALSLNLADLAAAEHRPPVEALLQKYRSGDAPGSLELDVLTKGGTRATLEINTRLARDEGRTVAIQCIARDITERKQAEANLRRSEGRLAEERTLLRTLIDNLPDYIYLKDLQGRYLLSNRAHVRLLGKADGVVGKTVFDLFAPEVARLYQEGDRQVIESGQPLLDHEEPSLKEGDLQRWLSTTKVPMRDGQGRIVGVIGISHDVTARKRAEEQLRKLSRAVEQSPASIVITDREGCIEYVNPRFTALSGYTLEEVQGQTPRILKSGETPPEGYARLWQTIVGGQQWQGELHNRKKNGELYWVAAAISPIRNDKGEVSHFLSIQEDITERRNLEQQLRHAQKMESVGQLAGGVAHDFNNIMTVIQGHTSLLLAEPDLKPEAAESLAQIAASVKRASDVTRQLLTFSRKQLMEPELLDLNEVLAGLARSLGRLLGETVTLDFTYGPDLPAVWGDVSMIEQIVMNLAVNARDAMPKGGRLGISTQAAEIDAPYAERTPEARPGNHICLAVEDTGCGMDEATLQRIFEPFFTTKDVGKGTGLGLATVYGIVKQHDGWVQVQSEVGRGTTFRVFFPARLVEIVRRCLDRSSEG